MSALQGHFDPAAESDELEVHLSGSFQNRAELISQLGLPRKANDATVLESAYRKWGERCPEHLLGEFSFAIVDAKRRRLFAARDPLGIQPFHYAPIGKEVLFASHVTPLSRHARIDRKPDETALVESLLDEHSDSTRSLYQGIFRLPAGHRLSADEKGLRTERYFDFSPGPVRELSDETCREELSDLLGTVVRSRLAARPEVGVLVSGGLDSSTLISLADSPAVHGLSLKFRETEASDRGLLSVLRTKSSWMSHSAEANPSANHFSLVALPELEDVPYHPSFRMFHPLFETAKQQGLREIWMGIGADELFTPGPAALSDLWRAGRFGRLWAEMKASDAANFVGFWRHVLQPSLPGPLRRGLRRLVPPKVPSGMGRHREVARQILEASAKRHREAEAKFPDWSRRSRYLRLFVSGAYPYGFEQQAQAVAAYGLELSFPLLDLRLVELAFRLPLEKLLWGRGQKRVLRDAMAGRLPDEVRLQPKFQDYTSFAIAVLESQRRVFEPWLKESQLLERGLVDRAFLDRLLRGETWETEINLLLHVVHLEKWLRTF